MNTIGERVKSAREAARLTQLDLAGKAGISQARLSAIEVGTTKQPTCVIELAKAMNICPIWLQTGTRQNSDWNLSDTLYTLINSLDEDEKVRQIAYCEKLLKERQDRQT
jgi:transcriptional regulator with XRE-family HTH domain